MSVIQQFLQQYEKDFDFYSETARICAQICETNMEQMGIRAIVTSRAKKPERLKLKLEQRKLSKQYDSIEMIREDIVDLSGVRIALYFPGDLEKVQQFMESCFDVKEVRRFPDPNQTKRETAAGYEKRFSGYWSTHFRVMISEQDLPGELAKHANVMIEIQVASALMHAWAEVEHDLSYKPSSGDLFYEEYQILDELNGLVLAGEIALERLQKAVKTRVSQIGKEFNNHYELAMFLYNKLSKEAGNDAKKLVLGRVDLLFQSLRYSQYNKPESLKEFLYNINPESKESSVVEQILDNIQGEHSDALKEYHSLKKTEELKSQMETLHINRENGNRQGEANTLANIGYLYSSKGNYEEAIYYFGEAVKINHEIGGVQGEANQLLNLASTHQLTNELSKALEYCDQAFVLHRQIGYKQGQANTLGMIGNISYDMMNYEKAIQCYQEALDICKETNYTIGLANQWNNLGKLFFAQGEVEKGVEFHTKALLMSRSIGFRKGEEEATRALEFIEQNPVI